MGGFYWAGAAEVGDHIVIGTDDGAKGTSGTSSLLSFKKTYVGGEKVGPVSSVSLTGMGDVRSSVTVDNGRVYFTTKGGYLCSAAVDADTGAISDLRSKAIGGQSTSTPVVYGDHVYFGAGSGMTDDGSSGSFVIADKETLEVKNRVELLGYPQCEMLLTTAYLETTGYLYFYSTYNMTPGGISLIRVKADDVSDARLSELYNAAGYGNYCISSVAADKNGNLYYKNDSGNIFCIGVKTVSDFADVSEKSYYYDAVAWGSAEGIVRGYSDTVFAPDDACTRAQIVTFLYRYAGSPAVSGECKFADVTDENYKNAIIWASENGIALGYSDTVFAPDTQRYGFKNLAFNFDSAAGIDYEVDVTKPYGSKINILRMSDGTPFDENRQYKVAMNSYRGNGGGELLTKGAGIPHDKLKSRVVYESERDQRYYLMKEIEKACEIDPKPNSNWRFVPAEWTEPAIKRDRKLLFGR